MAKKQAKAKASGAKKVKLLQKSWNYQPGPAYTLIRVEDWPRLRIDGSFKRTVENTSIGGEHRVEIYRTVDRQIDDNNVLKVYRINFDVASRDLVRTPDSFEVSEGCYRPRSFPAFLYEGDRELEDGGTEKENILFVQAAKDVVAGLRSKLNGLEKQKGVIRAEQCLVDIKKLLDIANDPHGAWYRFAKENRRSSAIFAEKIKKTKEYGAWSVEGDLSALYFFYQYGKLSVPVMVSHEGTIHIKGLDMESPDRTNIALQIWIHILQQIAS